MPNRSQRRAAAKDGIKLPIIDIRLFDTGEVIIDKYGEITDDQVEGFVQQILAKMQMDKLIHD